jgi:hypothetical protein
LLIDEAMGRFVASQLGIANTGTLGVLVAAAEVGLMDLQISLSRLLSTNFRISQSLINKVLAEAHQRNPNHDIDRCSSETTLNSRESHIPLAKHGNRKISGIHRKTRLILTD